MLKLITNVIKMFNAIFHLNQTLNFNILTKEIPIFVL